MDSEKVSSFSDSEATKGSAQNKIELLSCHTGRNHCQNHLPLINQKYSSAQSFLVQKDYMNSIMALKDAFYIATELRESSCLKCAELFRSTVTESLENINKELHSLTTGFLKHKRYELSYIESCNVLEEFKKST